MNLTRGQSRKSTETKRKTVYLARRKQAKTKLKLINITLMVKRFRVSQCALPKMKNKSNCDYGCPTT